MNSQTELTLALTLPIDCTRDISFTSARGAACYFVAKRDAVVYWCNGEERLPTRQLLLSTERANAEPPGWLMMPDIVECIPLPREGLEHILAWLSQVTKTMHGVKCNIGDKVKIRAEGLALVVRLATTGALFAVEPEDPTIVWRAPAAADPSLVFYAFTHRVLHRFPHSRRILDVSQKSSFLRRFCYGASGELPPGVGCDAPPHNFCLAERSGGALTWHMVTRGEHLCLCHVRDCRDVTTILDFRHDSAVVYGALSGSGCLYRIDPDNGALACKDVPHDADVAALAEECGGASG